ncbi:MAG: glycosyltransferase [Thermoleophilia bacterium]
MPPTAALTRDPVAVPRPTGRPVVDIVVPVYNEEVDLGPGVRRLRDYLDASFPFPARITIADNASTDGTWPIALALEAGLDGVRAVHIAQKGRGRALREIWASSDAAVLAYMDVDLSTDLAGLLPLVAPLISGHSDLAIGTRRARGARVVRGPKRELVSRAYNLLLRASLRVGVSDAQCGFKAIRADAARDLLPLLRDGGWFFDTEMLVLAERAGMRIHEVPVDWVDDPDSRVDILHTAIADLRGIARVRRELAWGGLGARLRGMRPAAAPTGLWRQAVRFAAIGVASTVAYVVLYLLLRGGTGAQAANAIALVATAIANTAANRRVTFGVRGARGWLRHQLQGLGVFAVGLALTSGSLLALHAATDRPPRAVEVAVLVAANAAATVVRFVMLRGWVFRPRRPATTHGRSSA